ncbi:VIT1/CCC1 transporter family protein [Mycobacterium sp.]|uniref:VIT1/CCC1 transporter family protein n=1 Tax=Mycobacterium sp. TaxID=1785 RepID=UPI002BF5A31A|nr:VIT1/CCC1 transporter family protein [Mycobacterium sp.]HME47427.1 VIT1/CCC1 transporter family protein [Mycobacterium sp.]
MSFFQMVNPHAEAHRGQHAGWLRAAVLGANDGLVSTASLMVGVAASGAAAAAVLTAGVAGLVAGSMAMAAGEYVSVSSQVDVERADRAKEARELAADPEAELAELAGIYRERGVPEPLAQQVAQALHDADPLGAHLRDELGHSDISAARPLQAGAASAASFFIGGLLPLLGLLASTPTARLWLIVAITLIGLAVTGILGAWIAGTGVVRPALRVLIGGGLAMAITAMVGQLVHVSGI